MKLKDVSLHKIFKGGSREVDINLCCLALRSFIKVAERRKIMNKVADGFGFSMFSMLRQTKPRSRKIEGGSWTNAFIHSFMSKYGRLHSCLTEEEMCQMLKSNIRVYQDDTMTDMEFQQLTIESAVNYLLSETYMDGFDMDKMNEIGGEAFRLACTHLYGKGFVDLTQKFANKFEELIDIGKYFGKPGDGSYINWEELNRWIENSVFEYSAFEHSTTR